MSYFAWDVIAEGAVLGTAERLSVDFDENTPRLSLVDYFYFPGRTA